MVVSIILILLGFLLLVKGADFLVEGAINIAHKFHIPEIVIGLTIVSIGTSLPELVVSLTSALEGHSDIWNVCSYSPTRNEKGNEDFRSTNDSYCNCYVFLDV